MNLPEPKISIRPARPEDAPSIISFNQNLARETEDRELDAATLTEGVQAILEDPTLGLYFVAECDREIVGQVMVTQEWSDWRNGVIWWLQSVYVHREFRQKGVFRRLFRHLQTLVKKDRRVIGLRLYVENHNTQARQTYARLGFQESSYLLLEQFAQDDPS